MVRELVGYVLHRKIGGRLYVNHGEFTQKSKAKRAAIRLRKEGCLVRVYPLKRTQWGTHGYIIYKNISCKISSFASERKKRRRKVR